MNSTQAPGGLLVLSGYGKERLDGLASLLSEALPRALWASPSEDERELRRARKHLRSGTSLVQVVETDQQLERFMELAEGLGARCLLVRLLPPGPYQETELLSLEQDAGPRGENPRRLKARANASPTALLQTVLEAWGEG